MLLERINATDLTTLQVEEDQPCMSVQTGTFLSSPSKRREVNFGVAENIMAGKIKTTLRNRGAQKSSITWWHLFQGCNCLQEQKKEQYSEKR